MLLLLFFMEAEFASSATKASLLEAIASSKLVWLTEAPSSRSSLSRLVWRSQNFVDAFVPMLWKHWLCWCPYKRKRRIKGYSRYQERNKKKGKVIIAYFTMHMNIKKFMLYFYFELQRMNIFFKYHIYSHNEIIKAEMYENILPLFTI